MAPGTAPGFGEKKGLSLNSAGDSSCPLPPPCTCPGLWADSTTDHFLLWGLRSEIGVWLDPGGPRGTDRAFPALAAATLATALRPALHPAWAEHGLELDSSWLRDVWVQQPCSVGPLPRVSCSSVPLPLPTSPGVEGCVVSSHLCLLSTPQAPETLPTAAVDSCLPGPGPSQLPTSLLPKLKRRGSFS